MLVKRIVARLGDVRTCCLALSVNIVGALILAFSFPLPLYFLGLVPWSFHMMLVPCLSSAASRPVGPAEKKVANRNATVWHGATENGP
jgi:hypothetical protein